MPELVNGNDTSDSDSMEISLQRLRELGENVIDTYSGSDSLPGVPDGFDMEKFTRGRCFFLSNAFSCTMSMLMSLISGLSVSNLLEPLVFTGQSHTPIKAIRRYVRTFQHVLLWHTGDVWQAGSKARRSIAAVRLMHNTVRADMTQSDNDDRPRVTQYDMSLVQCGFMGAIIMYPDITGICYTAQDLDNYCYFWYGIGYLLGVRDHNNICWGGLARSLHICLAIEQEVLLPALTHPPRDFYPMAQALIQGINLPFRFPLLSLEAFLSISYATMSVDYPRKLSFVDWLRTLFLRSLFLFVKYVPLCRSLFNHLILSSKG